MKLTTFILIITLMQVSATTFGQKVTIKEQGITLEKVFREIRKQTGYDVLIGTSKVEISKKINADFNRVPLSIVMDKIVQGTDLAYTIEESTVVIKEKEPSFLDKIIDRFSTIDIHGRVVDSEGQPLPGASVKVKGVNKVTSTNSKGEFYLEGVDENAVLVVSFIGYVTKEVAAAGTTMGDIRMEMATSDLEEVTINKGYYTTSKELNTGSVSTLKAADIAKQPVSDPLMALEGKIPGLQITQVSGVPGAGLKVSLRGRNSIANGNDPLYIIDGIPFNAKSLSKNQNAAGASMSPFTSIRPEDIESIDILKDADATAIYGSRGANGVILITTKKGGVGKTTADINVYSGIGEVGHKLELMNTQQYLAMRNEALKNDGVSPQSYEYDVNGTWDQSRYTDWQDVMIGGTSHFVNASASLSGGNEQTQFLFGTSYRKETTVFPDDNSAETGSGNLNIHHRSNNNKLNADISVNYSTFDNRLPVQDFTNFIYLAPDAPALFTPDGNLNWENSTFDNPLQSTRLTSNSKTDNFIANLVLRYNISKDLQFKSNFGYTGVKMDQVNIQPFSAFDPAYTNPELYRSQIHADNQIKTWIIEPQINYSKDINGHHIEALIGTSFQSTSQNGFQATASGFSSDALIQNFAAGTQFNNLSSNYTDYRYTAIYARLGDNYRQKYILNLTGRRDGSSRFGPKNRFGDFGAIGAAWIFSKEKFIKDELTFISFGKLRASLGKTGNDQMPDYAYLSTYMPVSGTFLGISGLKPSNLLNAYYGWETINKVEAGLELGFLKNHINLNISYYRNRTRNQLVGYSLPTITGFPKVTANLPAVLQNTGLEVEISTVNLKKDNFSWLTTATISFPRNKLVSYPNIEGSSYSAIYSVGQPLSVAYSYVYEGIDANTGIYKFTDLNNDGSITSAFDRIPIFYGTKFNGGISNTFSYKKISLDFTFQFVKQTGYSQNINTVAGVNNYNQPITALDHWKNVNEPGKFQKYSSLFATVYDASQLYIVSDAMVTDASFIRLRNVMLSWSLPNTLTDKFKLRNLRLYVTGQNLFTITGFNGLDPESQQSYGSANALPPLRIISAGLQLTF